jgi:hypothetical protein
MNAMVNGTGSDDEDTVLPLPFLTFSRTAGNEPASDRISRTTPRSAKYAALGVIEPSYSQLYYLCFFL